MEGITAVSEVAGLETNPGSENTAPIGPGATASVVGQLSTGFTVSATMIVTSPVPMLSARSVAMKRCCELGNG